MNAAVAAFAKRSFLVTGYYARRLADLFGDFGPALILIDE